MPNVAKCVIAIAMILAFTVLANSQTTLVKLQGYAERGGKVITTSPTTSYKVQESYPGATVTVYLAGTTTLATIYSDSIGTLQSNPFVADSKGFYIFYIASGTYDIKFSGTGITTPFTVAGVLANGGDDRRFPSTYTLQSYRLTQDNTLFSPLTWRFQGDSYVETTHPGAYFKQDFTGWDATLSYDPTPLTAAGIAGIDYPKVGWTIDGGTMQTLQLTSSTTTITLASNLTTWGVHHLEFYVIATQELNDRYLRPDEALRLTSISVTGSIVKPSAFRKTIEWDCDSLGEGINVYAAHTPNQVADADATKSFVYLVSNQLHAEYANKCFGGSGYARSVVSNLPSGTALFSHYSATYSFLSSSGLSTTQPDVAVCIWGTNDNSAGAVTTAVQEYLTLKRATMPKTRIIIIIPPTNAFSAAITTGFNNYITASFDNRVYLRGGLIAYSSTDGVHPTVAGNVTITGVLAPIIQSILDLPDTPNLASSVYGSVASASSVIAGHTIASLNNGERTGNLNAGTLDYWNGNVLPANNEWARVDFSSPCGTTKGINNITAYGLQDTILTYTLEPTSTMTFTLYGPVSFEYQYSTNCGGGWTTITGGSIVGNNKVLLNSGTFTTVNATSVRILFHTVGPGSGYANLTELEAYGPN